MKKILIWLLCLCLLTQSVMAAGASAEQEREEALSALAGQKTLAGVSGQELLSLGAEFPAGTSVCDWTAYCIGLLKAEKTGQYLSELRRYADERLSDSSVRDVRATEWHRVALTAAALGADPTCFGENNDLDLIALGTYNYAGESLGMQGLNGWIWALIALDSGDYAVPADARYSREEILSAILERQEEDGGFGLARGSSDTDITAMALQALAPYRSECGEAIERALAYLSGSLLDTLDFAYFGTRSAESAAQVIIALCALGIDPAEDERFLRGGGTLLDGLEAYRCADGSYSHEPDVGTGDFMATEQVMLAWLALWRLRSGQGSVYALHTSQTESGKRSPLMIVLPLTAAAAVGTLALIGRKKKHE